MKKNEGWNGRDLNDSLVFPPGKREQYPMRGWLNHWREATVALGRIYETHVTAPGGKVSKRKFFLSVGTGVIFGVKDSPKSTLWLLTAKHVLCEPSEDWDPSSLVLRFSWMDEMSVEQYPGVTLPLKVAGKRQWHSHPNKTVDLACIPLRFRKAPPGRKTWPLVSFEEIGTKTDLYEGEPIVVLGYPDTLAPDFGARPMVRQGIVSWVSSKTPESSLFCIDSHVFPGNSGGPVFRWTEKLDRSKRNQGKPDVCFLGLVTQARIHQLHLLAGGKEIEIHLQKKKPHETLFSQSYIGLGLVEPATRVKELLQLAQKKKSRKRKTGPTAKK